jgi:HSP20 family protein
MTEDIERMLDDFGLGRFSDGGSAGLRGQLSQAPWVPHVEVLQQNGDLIVRADLPATKESDIRVEVMNNTLILEGERKSEQREELGGVLRSEVSYGSFHRAIPLPEGVDAENAKASFENGVLRVALKLPQLRQANANRSEKRVDGAALAPGAHRRTSAPGTIVGFGETYEPEWGDRWRRLRATRSVRRGRGW